MKLKTLMMINNDNNSNFTQNEGSIVSDTEFSLNIVRLLYLLNDEINREIIIELLFEALIIIMLMIINIILVKIKALLFLI